jgi:hypothetical protein
MLTRLHPRYPLFRELLEGLRHFPELDHFGFQLVPSSQSAAASPSHWVVHPASELKQVRTLTFLSQGLLSSGVPPSPFHRLLNLHHNRTRYVLTYDRFQCQKWSMC